MLQNTQLRIERYLTNKFTEKMNEKVNRVIIKA